MAPAGEPLTRLHRISPVSYYELGLDTQQFTHPDGKYEGGEQGRHDDAETAAADLDHLVCRQLKPEQDDGDTKQPAQAEGHALFRPGGGTDDIVERYPNDDGQDHGTEPRHPREHSDGEGRSGDDRIQQEARQNIDGMLDVAALGGGGDTGIVIQRPRQFGV
jgi:hypothetical protein